MAETACVSNWWKISGWLRPTTKPNLLGGPFGKGVALGVGVGGGGGVAVGALGVGVAVGSGVSVGTAATETAGLPSLAAIGK